VIAAGFAQRDVIAIARVIVDTIVLALRWQRFWR